MGVASGFNQNDYLRDRQEQLKIQREFHRQLKDQSTIKIQQLFQETKDLNSKLVSRSPESDGHYSPVRRPRSKASIDRLSRGSRGSGSRSNSRASASGKHSA